MKLQTRTLALLAAACFAVATANAQVTIGSDTEPNSNALLELTEGTVTTKGLLLPRVALISTASASPLTAHIPGMHVYNTATAAPTPETAVTPGEYFNDGNKWVRVNAPFWFYAPSMALNLTSTGPHNIDLWQQYHSHFDGAGSSVVKNPAAPQHPKRTYKRSELNYYVTGYDRTVFQNTIQVSDSGVMTYSVVPSAVTDSTFINIIFVVK